MLKIAGAILVLAGCTFWGYMKCCAERERIEQLEIIKKAMIMLRGEIKYSENTLAEALYSISERIQAEFAKEFFLYVSKELKKFSHSIFKDIWDQSIEKFLFQTSMNKQDIEQFKGFGNNLGYLDKTMHLNTIDLYLEHLNLDIKLARDEITEKCRVYKCVSIAAGMFITIIIV